MKTKSTTPQIKVKNRRRGTHSAGGATVPVNKEALKHMIINRGYSIAEAAVKFDIDECRAERIIFSSKPTQDQFNFAFEIYDKGLSFFIACVGAGIAPKYLKPALRIREANKFKVNH